MEDLIHLCWSKKSQLSVNVFNQNELDTQQHYSTVLQFKVGSLLYVSFTMVKHKKQQRTTRFLWYVFL